MATIYELRVGSSAGIFAVPYRAGRPSPAVRLPDGAIVEEPRPDERREAPDEPEGAFGIGKGGVPATAHHANLGLIVGHLALSGVFLLPSGEVAAVYGAQACPIGARAPSAR